MVIWLSLLNAEIKKNISFTQHKDNHFFYDCHFATGRFTLDTTIIIMLCTVPGWTFEWRAAWKRVQLRCVLQRPFRLKYEILDYKNPHKLKFEGFQKKQFSESKKWLKIFIRWFPKKSLFYFNCLWKSTINKYVIPILRLNGIYASVFDFTLK